MVFTVHDINASTMVTGLVKGYALPDVGREIAIPRRLVAMKKRGQPDHPGITMSARANTIIPV